MSDTDQTAAPAAAAQVDPRLILAEGGVRGYLREFWRRVRGGELGSIPVVVGLIVIWAIFQSLNSGFLSPSYLTELSINIVATGMLALGIVFVLLLGEIDLSIGSVSSACAAIVAVANQTWGLSEGLSILLAVAAGLAMGLIHGFFFAKIGVPAFIVTLAGLLGWLGVSLWVLGKTGSYNLTNSNGLIDLLTNTYFEELFWGYLVAIVVAVVYFVISLRGSLARRRAGIPARSVTEVIIRSAVLAVVLLAVAVVFNQARGLPLAPLIFLAFILIAGFVLNHTSYGRKVFAVGGSIEAARRAGINVAAVRISVFAISGTMAAIGGVFYASVNRGVTQSGTGQQILMYAIAAAVIGGTSLFGGRGSAFSALLGVLVIQSIAAGMNLLGITNYAQYMVTGIVLLAAVVIDSVSRRSQKASGRA
ncbi:sugar ABC transporter permease [Actinocatenispora comari]|uniref:Xylose transport system permease protein XylH n=1 Tax=Actinocatenispora comari TaxID=2807577 RepID=A0A8J4AAA9_9ACTN|nr:sugar ABC transporter permease [Actinocatenispora comari]GIL26614.1 ABC transporter permease [Actinocatenispora comari]